MQTSLQTCRIVIVLGFLVFAHESGHFFVAKLFRVRVLVFSFGFGKRLFGFRKGATDYRVSLIPLGGYVRMAGDTPEENQPAIPTEFLSKPKWQRFLILRGRSVHERRDRHRLPGRSSAWSGPSR